MGNYFFEIPIYSMNEEKYYEKLEKNIQKELNKYRGKSKNTDDYKNYEECIRGLNYRDWEFNQIVGYLKLYRLNSRIYADFWKIDKQRIPFRLDKKVFKYRINSSPAWDIDLNKLSTSKSIFDKLMKELPNDWKDLYKKYHIDLSILQEVGPHIDWISLLDKYK